MNFYGFFGSEVFVSSRKCLSTVLRRIQSNENPDKFYSLEYSLVVAFVKP